MIRIIHRKIHIHCNCCGAINAKPLLTNDNRRWPRNARKRTNLDVVDIVPRVVVVCDVEVVHIVVVVIVVVVIVVVVAVGIVHNICTYRCSSPTMNAFQWT